jgi:hypothetical protein
VGFFSFIMSSINRIILSESGEKDIIDDKLEGVDKWLLQLDNSRKQKSLSRPLYDKIKQYIELGLVNDYSMLLADVDFFNQLKPSLRFKLVNELF